MLTKDIKIGLRVKVASNGLNAIVVGTPEYYTPKAKLVRIKYENSTRYEYMISKQLSALSLEDQYPALGGSFAKPEGHF